MVFLDAFLKKPTNKGFIRKPDVVIWEYQNVSEFVHLQNDRKMD